MTVYELIKEILANIDNPNAEVEFYNEKYNKYMRLKRIGIDSDNYSVQSISINLS